MPKTTTLTTRCHERREARRSWCLGAATSDASSNLDLPKAIESRQGHSGLWELAGSVCRWVRGGNPRATWYERPKDEDRGIERLGPLVWLLATMTAYLSRRTSPRISRLYKVGCPQRDSNPRSRLEGPRGRFFADYAAVRTSYQECRNSALVADFHAFAMCREWSREIRNHRPYSDRIATNGRPMPENPDSTRTGHSRRVTRARRTRHARHVALYCDTAAQEVPTHHQALRRACEKQEAL